MKRDHLPTSILIAIVVLLELSLLMGCQKVTRKYAGAEESTDSPKYSVQPNTN